MQRAGGADAPFRGPPAPCKTPRPTDDVVNDLLAFFDERIAFAAARGIRRDRLWLDPGIGFGKTTRHNLEILRRLDANSRSFNFPWW
jgi:dihydropteroate synthase